MTNTSNLKRLKRILGWTFLVSTLLLIIFSMIIPISPTAEKAMSPIRDGAAPAAMDTLPVLTTVTPWVIPAATLICYMITTILSWKKEKREVLAAELDMKKKQLEIEILQAELKDKDRVAH